MLEDWVSQFKQALDDIEGLKVTDKDAYDKAHKLIAAELISPLYMLLKMYRADYSELKFSELAEEFKYYVSVSGVEYYADGMTSTMLECYSELGI